MPLLALRLGALLLCIYPGVAQGGPFYKAGSSAMMPTLGEGDVVFALPYSAPKRRGDSVVFMQDGWVHFSRIMGLPGETIAVKNGIVLINGIALAQTRLEEPIADGCPDLMFPATRCTFYREVLAEGTSYVIIRSDTGVDLDPPTPTVLARGEYFVISDHRDSSVDSRTFGPIRDDVILGQIHNLTASARADNWVDRLAGFPDAK